MKIKYILTIFLVLAGCASEKDDVTVDLAPAVSRPVGDVNIEVMRGLTPFMHDYRENHFPAVHRGLLNFTRNLREPVTAINSVLMLDIKNVGVSASRFVINTTAGLLGFFDVAQHIGLERSRRDFGMVLGAWGVPMGGFFNVPIMGPTNTRDFAGGIVNAALDPIFWFVGFWPALAVGVSSGTLELYEGHSFIIATAETSLDPYVTFRTMYLQNRKSTVDKYLIFPAGTNSGGSAVPAGLDFDMFEE